MGDGVVARIGAPVPPPPIEADWHAALAGMTDAVAVIEADGSIAYANPYLLDLLGYDATEVTGNNLADYLHPEDLMRAYEVLELITGGTLGVALTPAEYRFLRPDGSWCPIEVNGSQFDPADPGRLLVLGRYSGDHDIQNRILEVLTSGQPIEAAIDLVPEFGQWRHPLEQYAVVTIEPDGALTAVGGEVAIALAPLDRAESPWGVAARTGVRQECPTEQLPPALRTAAEGHGLGECWAVPVPDPRRPGHLVLIAWTRAGGPAPSVHEYSLQMMERALGLILQWGQQVAGLEWAARHDPLTGAVNRNRFFQQMESLEPDDHRSVGVLYIDLDGFKAVNDAHGHAVGDAVLREVVARFEGATAPGHQLARIGGDEFALLCPFLTSVDQATAAADRILATLHDPVVIGDLTLGVGASIGVATTVQSDVRPDALIDRADRALYRAKSAGRGRWEISEPAPPA